MKTTNDRSSITILPATGGDGDRAAWLNAGNSRCATLPVPPKEVRRLVLLGAPGVGKGTQAALLHQWSGACHLSTGDIFRAAKSLPQSERTPAIQSALGYMARGALVPDQTVLALLYERLRCLRCTGGFLLDGFPRTVAQAEALERLLKAEDLPLTRVIDYELPIEKIVERLAGRAQHLVHNRRNGSGLAASSGPALQGLLLARFAFPAARRTAAACTLTLEQRGPHGSAAWRIQSMRNFLSREHERPLYNGCEIKSGSAARQARPE